MILFSIVLSVLFVWSLVRLYGARKQSSMKLKFCVLFVISMILFIIDAISVNYTNFMWVEHCQFNDSYDDNPTLLLMTMIMSISIITALATMYVLFSLRLICIFDGCILEISNKLKYYLNIVASVQITLSVLIWLVYAIDPKNMSYIALFASIILLLYIFNSIFSTVVFSRKLQSLTKFGGSQQGLNQTITITREIASKIIVCMFFALLSTAFLVVLGILVAFLTSHYVSIILRIAVLIDSVINSLCLTLQWNFSHDLYGKLCKSCHTIVKNIHNKEKLVQMTSVSVGTSV